MNNLRWTGYSWLRIYEFMAGLIQLWHGAVVRLGGGDEMTSLVDRCGSGIWIYDPKMAKMGVISTGWNCLG